MNNFSIGRITIALLLTLTWLFVSYDSIWAQQSDRPRNSVTINTDLVVTWAQIFDRKDGKVVKGLEKDDFLLKEEGKPQRISFIKEGQPYSVVLLLKVLVPCGGDAYKLDPGYSFHRGGEALRQLGDDTEVALMAWDNEVKLIQPMTRDYQLITDRLDDRDSLRNAIPHNPSPGRLARPGDAIYQAAQYLEKAASPERRKIIIITDVSAWIDKQYSHTAADVKALLEKTGITVYGLYQWPVIQDIRKSQRHNSEQGGGGTIEDYVEQTGGSILVGKLEESDDLLIKLASMIRSSYTIGYYPENSNFDGGFRRISLELSPRGKTKAGKVEIKTRNGYRAIRPSSQDASSEIQPQR